MTSDAVTVRLSRDVIVDAYLRIADAEGTDDITLRRLGTELGVDPTAIYRHFRDKDELLAVAADRVIEDSAADLRPSGSWREDLRAIQLGVRRAYLTHPKAIRSLQLSPIALPTASALVDRAIGLLREAGFDEAEAATAFEMLESYTIGVAIFDAGATDESLGGWRRVYASLPPETYPHVTAVSQRLYRDAQEAFTYGLDLLLEALERRAEEGRHG